MSFTEPTARRRFGELSLPNFAIVAAAVILADQLTKLLIALPLQTRPPIVLIPRFLQFIHRTNTGAAWSQFEEHPEWIRLFATGVAIAIAIWSFRLPAEELRLRLPLGLILGGAIGNLIDRYRLGHVIDFIDAHWDERYHFPTFNVADSAIFIGMSLMILFHILTPSPPENADEAGAGKAAANEAPARENE